MQRLAKRYDTGEPILLQMEGRLIVQVEPLHASQAADAIPPVSNASALAWVAPALVDLQVNGYGGREFASDSLELEDVVRIATAMASQGVARFCPTVTTTSPDTTARTLRTIALACREDQVLSKRMPAVHLEGPFITTEDGPRGAHPHRFCRPPDWDLFRRWQDAAEGRIRIVTLSPEYEESLAFITNAVAAGVVVAIGHTHASPTRICEAIDSGARLGTHLGNGCHPQLHRHRNYLWPQLADDRLTISLIADGHHLPTEVLRVFTRAKGTERCILVSDMSGLAGLPPGRYESSLCDIDVLADGRLVVAGQQELLAAASSPLFRNVAHLMESTEIPLRTAIDMASAQPARLLNLPANTLAAGHPADLIFFDRHPAEGGDSRGGASLRLREVIMGGEPTPDSLDHADYSAS